MSNKANQCINNYGETSDRQTSRNAGHKPKLHDHFPQGKTGYDPAVSRLGEKRVKKR